MRFSTHRVAVPADLGRVFALTLAGGQSSRLFPFNKVLSDLTGSGRTLIQQAFDRATATLPRGDYRRLIAPNRFYVLTGESMVLPIKAQLGLSSNQFLVDPARRGTWPAILWAMAHLRQLDSTATLAVLTSDHIIPQVEVFRGGVAKAIAWAQQNPAVVLLGVTPNRQPENWKGFGCFRMGKAAGAPARPIESFEEKPAVDRAAGMIAEGGWVWNAGMFFFRIDVAEAALRRYQPAMADLYQTLCDALKGGHLSKARALYKSFPAKIPHPLDPSREVDNTIDYAIMAPLVREPSDGGASFAIPGALPEWMDVGEWTALRSLVKPDRKNNVRLGRVSTDPHTSGCILAADRGVSLEASNIHDLLVSVTKDWALVIPLREVAKVKAIVGEVALMPKDRVVQLGLSKCRVNARGGRIAVYGCRDLEIRLAKNRLRVTALPSSASGL